MGQDEQFSRSRWVRQYVVGLAFGAAAAAYGVYALASGHAFLPGLKARNSMLHGAHGRAMAIAYLAGGLFLVCRFFFEARCRTAFARGQVYIVQNVLLVAFVAAVVYVLLSVSAVG